MDRAGRVQVPREFRQALALTRRVRLALEPDHVTIRPDSGSARMSGEPLLSVRGVHRRFGTGPTAVHALRGVSFDVAAGTMVALVGRSGSGKTTLLNVIGGLDRPDAGTVHVDGTDVTALDEDGLSRLRREKVSYVFQSFGLIPVLSAAENVARPAAAGPRRPGRARAAGRAAAGAGRPGRPRRAAAGRAVRRPAAAGGDRPRAGRLAPAAARRRAHRATGRRDGPVGDGPAARDSGVRRRHRAGVDARRGDDGPGRPGDPHPRRAPDEQAAGQPYEPVPDVR